MYLLIIMRTKNHLSPFLPLNLEIFCETAYLRMTRLSSPCVDLLRFLFGKIINQISKSKLLKLRKYNVPCEMKQLIIIYLDWMVDKLRYLPELEFSSSIIADIVYLCKNFALLSAARSSLEFGLLPLVFLGETAGLSSKNESGSEITSPNDISTLSSSFAFSFLSSSSSFEFSF